MDLLTTLQKKERAPRNKTGPLNQRFREDDASLEIGVDEAGRGPLFGRLYVAAVILPNDRSSSSLVREGGGGTPSFVQPPAGIVDSTRSDTIPSGFSSKEGFRHDWMKDSKRFSSQKKIREVAEYIKTNAVAWTVRYAESGTIDEINIRQAVLKTMRECCRDLIERAGNTSIRLLIDGNDFPAYTQFDPVTETLIEIESHTVEGGDNQYTCIAAASILAKVARDEWIEDLCKEYPYLSEWYGLDRNKGYGTADHMRGIRDMGLTEWHRKSYGPCKNAPMCIIPSKMI